MIATTTGVSKTVTASISGAGAVAGLGILESMSVHAFGVPAMVVIFAAVGAFLAVAYSEPIRPLLKMVATVLVNIIFGVIAAINAHMIPGFGWVSEVPQWTTAFCVSFLCLWILPIVIDRLPNVGNRVMGEKKQG